MISARLAAACVTWLALAGMATAQSPPLSLYRVFLTDGTTLASYGEWARVGEQVIFSMPLAPSAGPGELQLVSLPIDRIDLGRTERYAESVRAAHYAATRGEADFAALSNTVAYTLNQVALMPDPRQRLATALQARRALTDWPGARHGYRQSEVREIVGVLDEVIAGLGASAGQSGFELSLTANTTPLPPEPLIPAPTHTEVVQQLMAASAVVSSPAEKVSILQSVVSLVDRAVEYLPSSVAAAIRATALGQIAEEQRVDEHYASLRSATMAEASRHAARADVRALEALRARVHEQDVTLGSRRPSHMAALVAALDAQRDGAHRLRLAHDQWLLNESRLRSYRRAISPYVQALVSRRASFDDIKLLAGPAPQTLRPLARELERHARVLALIKPPPLATGVHAGMRSAYQLAENAVQLRRDAIDHGDVDLAHQASAAAAGAMMLLERAREELRAALEPPIPPRTAGRQ